MKKLFSLILLFASVCGYSQSKLYIRGDSIFLQRDGGNSELILLSGTRSRTNGFLQNRMNGRTQFAYAVDSAWKQNDSTLIFRRGDGNDTIEINGNGSGSIGSHTHPESDITGLVSDLALKAALASPTFTGTPAAPTAAPGTNTTQIATTAFVAAAIIASSGTSSGTYTPTVAASVNVTSYVMSQAHWIQVGNIVTMSGAIFITITSASTPTTLDLSLPVASDLVVDSDLNGVMSNSTNVSGLCYAEVTGDNIRLSILSPASGGLNYTTFSLTYKVTPP